MERDLDGAIARIIDRMLTRAGIVRRSWCNDGPGSDLQFHTYARQGIDPTCMVRRKQIIGEGLDNHEMTHVRFELTSSGHRLTPESRRNLSRLVRDGIEQKRRHDAIVAGGGDVRRPPPWSITMHRIGRLLLSRNAGRRTIVDIEGRPALNVENGPPPFPIVKGRVKDSPIHQQALHDDEGRPALIFRNKLGTGLYIPGTILPDTVIQSIGNTRPDVSELVSHPLFGERTGVAVMDVAVTSDGTHLFLEGVQDRMEPEAGNGGNE